MAFKSKATAGVGTTATAVTNTVAASTTHTIIGLSAANIVSGNITVAVKLVKSGGSSAHIVKDATILPGGALVVVGGDQKLVLEAGDSITVGSNTATSVDAIISWLEA